MNRQVMSYPEVESVHPQSESEMEELIVEGRQMVQPGFLPGSQAGSNHQKNHHGPTYNLLLQPHFLKTQNVLVYCVPENELCTFIP